MTSMDVRHFLEQQTKQYKIHQSIINRVQTTLQHQHQIQSQNNIPKKHRPKPPIVIDTDRSKEFTETFTREYEKFFFKELQEAITQNTVTLELERARCSDILRHTEVTMSRSNIPTSLLTEYYSKFLQQLQITDRQPLPELQHKLKCPDGPRYETSSPKPMLTLTPTQTTCGAHQKNPTSLHTHRRTSSKGKFPTNTHKMGTKRKNAAPQPQAKKQLKIDHFLSRGQKAPSNLT